VGAADGRSRVAVAADGRSRVAVTPAGRSREAVTPDEATLLRLIRSADTRVVRVVMRRLVVTMAAAITTGVAITVAAAITAGAVTTQAVSTPAGAIITAELSMRARTSESGSAYRSDTGTIPATAAVTTTAGATGNRLRAIRATQQGTDQNRFRIAAMGSPLGAAPFVLALKLELPQKAAAAGISRPTMGK